MLVTSLIGALALLAGEAAAHGAVEKYKIGGQDYPGFPGFSPSSVSKDAIQRQWPNNNPVTTAGAAGMRCNGGTSAPNQATAKPGDAITATWNQWTHSQGPVMVWLYKCAGDFKACDGSGKGWFKIDQGGYTPKSGIFLDTETPSGWAIATIAKTKQWTTTLPNVVPGNYILRHELIALHSANAPQYYPECAQLVVTGSGTLTPTAEYLVAIPGYVSQNDPSVNFNINNHNVPQNYTCPGPAVFGATATTPKAFTA